MPFRDFIERNTPGFVKKAAPYVFSPVVAGGVALGRKAAPYVQHAADRADRGIQKSLDAVELGTDYLNRKSGGVLTPVHESAKTARTLYGTGSNVARKLPIMLSDRKYSDPGAPLDGARAGFGRGALPKYPDEQKFLAELKAKGLDLNDLPSTRQLLQSLGTQTDRDGKNYLETEGRAAILRIAERRGAKGLEQLAGVLNGHLAGGKDQAFLKQLAADGLRDVAFPTTIEQGAQPNCGGIALQQFWAQQEPRDYLDGMMTLGQNKPYRLPSGKIMTPLNAALKNPQDVRQTSVKVVGDALSAFAHDDSLARYSIQEFGKMDSRLENKVQVLDRYHPVRQKMGIHSPHEIQQAMNSLTGKNYQWKTTFAQAEASDDLSRGRIVPTLLAGSAYKEWHWVNLTGQEPNQNGEPTMRISSWGKEYKATRAELEPYMRAVLVQDDGGRLQPATGKIDNGW